MGRTMSAKDFQCVICGNYIRGSGKLCSRCNYDLVNSHEWKQVLREKRDKDRRIRQFKEEIKQAERAATIAWVKRRREEREHDS